MNAPANISDVDVDPRLAFLLVAATHYDQVLRGEESVDYAFDSVTGFFDRVFPPEPECCEVCGVAPCGNPSFCDACRVADAGGAP
jgi:hypothetical protein